MADIDIQEQTLTADPLQADIAAQMAMALGQNAPQAAKDALAAQSNAQTAPDSTTQPTAEAVTETTTDVSPFSFDTLKTEFGYEKPEDMIAEIKSLRDLKNAPAPAAAEPMKFADEASEKLYKAWTAGKKDEVLTYLKQVQDIDSLTSGEVTKESAASIVKLGIQLQSPDLTPAEVDRAFKKSYGAPAQPKQGANEEDDDYAARVSEWKDVVSDNELDLMIAAKQARPNIVAAKSKLVLPEIPQSTDPEYVAYKQAAADSQKITNEAIAAYKAIPATAIETKIAFNDEANKIGFDYEFKPDPESFAKTAEMAIDEEKFYANFVKPDGTPDRPKFMKALYFAVNAEKMLTEAMKQAKNATIKSMLPDNSQGSGLVRQLPQDQGQQSDLDIMMQRVGVARK